MAPLFALASAAVGIGSSLIGASSREKARKAENKSKKRQADAEKAAVRASTKATDQLNEINYAWKVAETEALRFQEAQAKSDFEWRQGRLTEAALANLNINEQAIFDQYVSAEDLRATQDELSLNYDMGALGIEANDRLRGYMTAIQDNALRAQQESLAANRQMETLIKNQVLDGQLDTLQRDIQFAASLADRGAAKASGLGRGTSATTAKSLQMNAAKTLGRSFGELLVRQRERKNSIATMNATMQGETAKGLARYAVASGRALADAKSSNKRLALDSNNRLNSFERLTMPGYKLAGRQGQRELDSLFLRTEGQLDEARIPYRENIIFDAQKPLPSMFVNIEGPTYRQPESAGSVIGGAVVAGINGALKGTFAKQSGGLGWF